MSARQILDELRQELAGVETTNRFVDRIATGALPLRVVRALACEEYRTTRADQRSFTMLAARYPESPAGEYFLGLASGEVVAIERLRDMATAVSLTAGDLEAYEPDPRCQAYPAYVAWLALNGTAADAVIGLVSNFATWGEYCGSISRALRQHYQLDESGTGFFDLFGGESDSRSEALATAVIEASLESGAVSASGRRAARMLHAYELMFWDALVDSAEGRQQ
jgi:thiaminase